MMTNRQAKLAVVIPTYNRAALVERCLKSLRQSGVGALEIVVVDDGGNDETAAVAADLGAMYIYQSNAGPAAARNAGVAATSAPYVTFLDSDDEWIGGGFSRLVEHADANDDVDVVFADSLMGSDADGFVSFVRAYGDDTFFSLPHALRPSGLRVLDPQPFFLQLSTKNVMFLGSTLFRRDLIKKVDGFDRKLRGAADWDLFMRAAVAGVTAYSDGDAVCRYVKHGSGMSTESDHMEEDFIRALDSVRQKSALSAVQRDHVEDRLRAHVFGWAWNAYNAGDLTTTRQRLRWARHLGQMRLRELTYFLATYLPGPLVSSARQVRQGLQGRPRAIDPREVR